MTIPLNLTQLFSNNAVSLLALPITAGSTSLKVITGHGATFPQPGTDEFFLITLEDQSALVREIIKVTGRVGDTFTFDLADRGMEGTTPHDWSASAGNDTLVDHRITAETLRRASQLPLAPLSPGQPVFNQAYILVPAGSQTVLELDKNFAPGSSCLYVGGLRQKLGVDYTETAPDKLTLQFLFTQADIDSGQHVTVDYVPM